MGENRAKSKKEVREHNQTMTPLRLFLGLTFLAFAWTLFCAAREAQVANRPPKKPCRRLARLNPKIVRRA